MATQTFNQESDFAISGSAIWDSGIKLTGSYPVSYYGCQDASGSILTNDIGTDGVIGSNFNYQDAGPFASTYALSSPANDYCSLTGLILTTSLTIDFWYRPTAADIISGHAGLCGQGTPRCFTVYMQSGKLIVIFNKDGLVGSNRLMYSGTIFSADTWYHIRVSTNGTTDRLSVDGVEYDTNTDGGGINSLTQFNLGSYYGYSVGVTGRYAGFAVYDSQLPSTYTTPTAFPALEAEAEAIITADAGAGKAFDLSTALDASTGTPTITYQITDDVGATNYVPVTPENLAALQVRSDTARQNTKFKIFISGDADAVYTQFSIDEYDTDVTPATDVTAGASTVSGGTTDKYNLITTFVGGSDAGAGYAGANFEIERDNISLFQQSNGTFLADETFANLLLKGEALVEGICYALGEADIPTRYRVNTWDNNENKNQGDWANFFNPDEIDYADETDVFLNVIYANGTKTGSFSPYAITTQTGNLVVPTASQVEDGVFFESSGLVEGIYDNATDPDYVLASASGNWVDQNLLPTGVKYEVLYGIGESGAYSVGGKLAYRPEGLGLDARPSTPNITGAS